MFGLYNLAGLYTWGEVGEWVSSCLLYTSLAQPLMGWLLAGMGLSPQWEGNLTLLAGSGLFVICLLYTSRCV